MSTYLNQHSNLVSALPSSPFLITNPNQHCIGSIDTANQHKLLVKTTVDQAGARAPGSQAVDSANQYQIASRPRRRSNQSKKDLVHQQLRAVQDSLALSASEDTLAANTLCFPSAGDMGVPTSSPFASSACSTASQAPPIFGSLPLSAKLSVPPRLSMVAASAAAAVTAAHQHSAAFASAAQPYCSTAPPSSSLSTSPALPLPSWYEPLDGLSQKPYVPIATMTPYPEKLLSIGQTLPLLSSQPFLSSSPPLSSPLPFASSATTPSNASVTRTTTISKKKTTTTTTTVETITPLSRSPPSPVHREPSSCASTVSSLKTKKHKNKNKSKARQRSAALTNLCTDVSNNRPTLLSGFQEEKSLLDESDRISVTSRTSIASLSRSDSGVSSYPSPYSSSPSSCSSYSFPLPSSDSSLSSFPSSPSSVSSASVLASGTPHYTTTFSATPPLPSYPYSRSSPRAASAPRKRFPETPILTPLDTKPSRLYPPAFNASRESLSSLSTMLSSTGSSPTAPTFSEASTAASSPTSPMSSTNLPSPSSPSTIHDLTSTEATYISTLKSVSDTLNQVSGSVLASGRKDNASHRNLIKRWNELIRVHSSFHEGLSKSNFKDVANALNVMLVTLEPTLMDHGRDLGSALKKLVRTDQKNEHALTDWDTALRLPFERLYAYDSWLQRIDPASTFAKEPRAHIAGLSHRIRTVTDASPNSKGVLRRLSTIARGVMKRKSTATFGGLDQLPEEPVTPATSMTVASTGAFDSTSIGSTASIQSNFTHTRTLSSTTGSKGLSNSSEDTIETVMDTTVDEVAELAVKPRRGIFPRRSLDSARPLSGWFADTRSSKHKEQGQPDQEQAAAPVAAIKHEPLPKRYSLFIEPDVNDTFSVQSFVKELKLDSYLFNNVIAESPTHTGASTPSPPSPRPASSRFSTKSVRNDNDSIMTNHSTHQNTEMTTVSYDINFSKDEDTAMTNAEDDGDAALTTPATTTGITKPNPQTQQPAATTISTSTPMPTPISTHQRKRTTSQNLSPRQRQGRHQESINGIVASASKNLEALAPVQQGATLSTASSFESLQTKRSTTSLTSTSSATTLASSKDVSKMETARLPPLPRPSTPMSIALPTQQPYKPKSFTAAAAASQLPPLRPKTHLTIATPSMPLSPLMASPRSTASSLATTPTSPSYPVVSKDLMALRRANMMAKAECLHLPRDIVPKSGVDQLRITNAKQKAEKKPPVRSLISFWEQVSDPADADC